MFEDIGNKLRNLAVIIFYLSVIVGGIWLIFSLVKLPEYLKYLEYRDINDYFSNTYNAKAGLIYSITLVVSGVAASFLIYGFGELVNNSYEMNAKLQELKLSVNYKNVNEKANSELISSTSPDGSWVCTNCGTTNSNIKSLCSECKNSRW